MKRIYFDKGGCDDGCSANENSFEQSLKGEQGIQGKQGERGLDGKSSLINGSVTDGTDDSNGTADDALNTTAVTNLASMGFDVETDSSLRATIDTSDTVNKKTWIRLSNKLFNLIGLEIQPKLLPPVGTAGNVLTSNGTIWTSSTPVNEIYNTTSTTSISIASTLVGTNVTMTVASGLAYRFGIPVRAVDNANNSNYIEGIVASYTGTSLVFNVTRIVGSGTPSSWKISIGSLLNVPYFSSSVGANGVLQNDGTSLYWGTSPISTGYCMPWFGYSIPSNGWAECNGTYIDIAITPSYTQLYKLLCPTGVTNKFNVAYGANTGRFDLPNLVGRVPVGIDASDTNINELGERFGEKTTTLTAANLPEACPYPATAGNITFEQGIAGGGGGQYVSLFNTGTGVTGNPTQTPPTITMGSNTATGDTPFSRFQPSTVCTWIIKL